MTALILVDLQNDFMPGGALAVKDGNKILPAIRALQDCTFDYKVATKDWHPANHKSFAANHGLPVGSHIKLNGIDQILWPTHCVQNSRGSEFTSGWEPLLVNEIVYKGTDKEIDSYSSFYDNGHIKSTGLLDILKVKGINEIFLAGLATDYCIKYSALDALKHGFKVNVIIDACQGVNLNKNDSFDALVEMEKAGALLISSKDVIKQFGKKGSRSK
jgi:nicotinamidase/pyrazinamidase